MRQRGVLFVSFVVLDLVLGVLTGFLWFRYVFAEGSFHHYAALECSGVLTTLAAICTSGVEIGSPDVSVKGRRLLTLASCLFSLSLVFFFCVAARWLAPALDSTMLSVAAVVFAPTFTIGLRGLPAHAAAAGCLLAIPVRVCLMEPVDAESNTPFLARQAIILSLSAHTRYLCDQRLLYAITSQPVFGIAIGMNLAGSMDYISQFRIAVFSTAAVALIGLNHSMRRRKRHLPPGLQQARFVRLGYLQRLQAAGERIQRCQDLPEEAFGNPARAMHLVVTSHRWHHPLFCDVCTSECPEGSKLSNVLQRLEEEFSPRALSSAVGICGKLGRAHSAYCVGGWDVIIFLDYMCIPQAGVDADGKEIARSLSEKTIFDECLPCMGSLYSIFPVLVLRDAPDEDCAQGYDDSGWCYCEFVVANLGQQIGRFSKDMECPTSSNFVMNMCMMRFNRDTAAACEERVCSDLAEKHFAAESDRRVAQRIIRCYFAKRLLIDAIRSGCGAEVRRLLSELHARGLDSHTLSEPIDTGLNTLLHLAVQCGFAEAARDLIASGARGDLRNLRGDMPSQWFSAPRLGRAAAACRAAAPLPRGPRAEEREANAPGTPSNPAAEHFKASTLGTPSDSRAPTSDPAEGSKSKVCRSTTWSAVSTNLGNPADVPD